ncbi:MAG TPA: RNA polymerase sigma factor [Candidatus Angelobacter sp.]|nr:RNA polymerase sigma factor [Candidatus Angelobacter sp.]
MPEEIPIRDLLDRCLSSENEELWLAFVRRTQPMMANVIMNTVRRWKEPNPGLVDDLLQETFLKLFAHDRKALRSIRNAHENTIFGYLKVVAGNTARDHFRSPKNKIEEIEATDLVVPPSPDGWDRISFNRLKDKIQERLDRLSSSETYQRDVSIFWLYYEQGYSAKEVASIPQIGLTTKGVESTLLRLTKLLKEEGLEPPGQDRAP